MLSCMLGCLLIFHLIVTGFFVVFVVVIVFLFLPDAVDTVSVSSSAGVDQFAVCWVKN